VPERIHAIDWLKAIAVLGVVLAHSGPAPRGALFGPLDHALRQVPTTAVVPIFLMAAGFLYARDEPIPPRVIGERLMRLLIPYVIASGAVWLFLRHPPDLATAIEQLLFASAFGIYYFIAVLALCIPCTWALSRLPKSVPPLLAIAAFAYLVLPGYHPAWSRNVFWSMRNPLEFFYLGYFLTGWSISMHREQLATAYIRVKPMVWGAALTAIGLYVATRFLGWSPLAHSIARVGYSLGIGFVIVALTWGRRAPQWVVWLSGATLTIYLYHQIFIRLVLPYFVRWPMIPRTLVLMALALAGCWWLLRLAEPLLGRRTRMLLGAD
jgi:peptidoglycan/LPS O-acetylase OafA/YrhL